MRFTVSVLVLLSVAPAAAQAPPVHEDEIIAAYQLCERHRVPPTTAATLGRTPMTAPPATPAPSTWSYDPEWKEDCETVAAAYRALRDQQTVAAHKGQVGGVAARLKKKQ